MALIKMSSIGITNLSGKAGGSVYAHNRGGSYVRNFAVPSNPQSPAQSAARSAFGAFASKWRQLTEEQRNAWNAASKDFPYVGRFGEERFMSGENLYISLNRNLELVSGVEIVNPPVPQGVDGVTDVTLLLNSVGGVVEIIPEGAVADNAEAETNYIIYASPALSAGISYAKNRLRFIMNMTEDNFTSGTDIISFYEAVFGTPPVGAKLFFRFDPINIITGERGASFFASGIVVEP